MPAADMIVEPGDTVTVEADEWHWHDALPEAAMSHLVVQYPGGDLSFDVARAGLGRRLPGALVSRGHCKVEPITETRNGETDDTLR
jgi:hypothetical protein